MKYKRLSATVICLLWLWQVMLILMPGASAAGTALDGTYVVDDLNAKGVDITKYQGDAGDSHVEILDVTEFGYKANGDFSEYGLYLYLYNPSGKVIQSSDQTCIQLAYGLKNGGVSGYGKYRLQILSWSTKAGYENVFYKVKVVGAESFAAKLNMSAREYRISGIELLRDSEINATDLKIGGTFIFTGFHKGCFSNDSSTLRVHQSVLDVAELELHPVTYRTITSSVGSYVSGDEIFGVYFSIPQWVIKKYGNPNDDTLKGLEKVEGTYCEKKTNGILTDSSYFYEKTDSFYKRSLNIYFQSMVYNPAAPDDWSIMHYYNPSNRNGGGDRYHRPLYPIYALYNSFFTSKASAGLSSAEFLELYNAGDRLGEGNEDETYVIEAKDVASASQVTGFGKFMSLFWFGQNPPYAGDVSFEQLIRVESMEVLGRTDKYVSSTFLMNEADAADFRRFVVANENPVAHDPIYLMRFAVRKYATSKITDAATLDDKKNLSSSQIGNSYYFEQTVFENFDILQLTFRTEKDTFSVVPVSASPIDVVGGITVPGDKNPNDVPDIGDNGQNWWDILNSLQTWVKVLGAIVIIFVLALVIKLFGGLLAPVFSLLGKGIGAIFRGIGSLFRGGANAVKGAFNAKEAVYDSKRKRTEDLQYDEDRRKAAKDRSRKQKYEDEDRATAAEDRKRRQSYEDADRATSAADRQRKQKYEDSDRATASEDRKRRQAREDMEQAHRDALHAEELHHKRYVTTNQKDNLKDRGRSLDRSDEKD